MEHLPGSPHPRIRNPEIRRRPGETQRLRTTHESPGGAQGRLHHRDVPDTGGQALVLRRDAVGADETPRHRVPGAGWLRRGVPRPEDAADLSMLATPITSRRLQG